MALTAEEMMKNASSAAQSDDEVQGTKTQKTGNEKIGKKDSELNDTHKDVQKTGDKPITQEYSNNNTFSNNMITPQFLDRIIGITDQYRHFNDDSKFIVQKFFQSNDIATIVSYSLQEPVLTLDAIQSILNVTKAEGVDKAFYLVDLSDDILHEMGKVLQLLTDNTLEDSTHNRYCRQLVNIISTFDGAFLNNVQNLLNLLQKAQPKE